MVKSFRLTVIPARTLSLFMTLSIIQNTIVYIPFESPFFALHDKRKINLIALFSEKRFDRILVRASYFYLFSESI